MFSAASVSHGKPWTHHGESLLLRIKCPSSFGHYPCGFGIIVAARTITYSPSRISTLPLLMQMLVAMQPLQLPAAALYQHHVHVVVGIPPGTARLLIRCAPHPCKSLFFLDSAWFPKWSLYLVSASLHLG